jgi:hypothetical protein
MKRININIIIAVFLITAVVIARIVNASMHLPNFVPIAAIGIFSGAIIKDKRSLAFLIPILGLFLADVYFQLFTAVPGFYDLPGQLFNYGAVIAATAIGTTMKQPKPLATIGYLLGGSAAFFIVSNFGYFVHGWNGYSFAGLTKTYIDAIPFYKNSFIADMLGGVVLFGGYFAAQQALLKITQKATA